MKKIIIFFALGCLSINVHGFEIFALGTSNTNCKGAGQAYTNTLNDLLARENINAQVINAGVDGDKPAFMMARLEQGLKNYPNTKMVIFEPGPNERNVQFSLDSSAEILAYLKKINMPTIFVSNSIIFQSVDAGAEFARKYDAYYYGHRTKNIPKDHDHRQFDMPGGGHATALGCQLWAQNMFPLLDKIIKEKNIR